MGWMEVSANGGKVAGRVGLATRCAPDNSRPAHTTRGSVDTADYIQASSPPSAMSKSPYTPYLMHTQSLHDQDLCLYTPLSSRQAGPSPGHDRHLSHAIVHVDLHYLTALVYGVYPGCSVIRGLSSFVFSTLFGFLERK